MLKEEFIHSPLFQGLSAEQLKVLESVFNPCDYAKGEVIFEQGQIATNLFILVSGEVVIRYKPYDGPALTVARIRPGGVFGWSAALGRDVYTSGAAAEENSKALGISGNELHRFCEKNPEVGMALLERLAGVIAARLRNTHSEILTILTKGMDMSDDCWRRLATDG